jgi:hypothetical protein
MIIVQWLSKYGVKKTVDELVLLGKARIMEIKNNQFVIQKIWFH